jgi:serine protease AprX
VKLTIPTASTAATGPASAGYFGGNENFQGDRADAASPAVACPLCGLPSRQQILREANWLPGDVEEQIQRHHPEWREKDGACPACIQQALLQTLLERGDAAMLENIQSVWPLDAEAAFGALPTPLRMHGDPRFSGRGVTLAMIDAAFYPHPDLVRPHNRILAWADTSRARIQRRYFKPSDTPAWPGWNKLQPAQWHGMMTSSSAAGNGWMSHGLYRGLASEANLVLVQVWERDSHVHNASIARALRWLLRHRRDFNLHVVNVSVGGDPVSSADDPELGDAVDEAVAALTAAGVTVIAAAGNDGQRQLRPPATAPTAITVGGIDDHNVLDDSKMALWHSNYGITSQGSLKPELVAPSLWVVAPVLPGSEVARKAAELMERRNMGDTTVDQDIAALKLVTPYYQHVEGTSFAAPIVASVVACMLEANPSLSPGDVREILEGAARQVPGAPPERQGAGALDAGIAVALALDERHSPDGHTISPQISSRGISFLLHDRDAKKVQVIGSWDGWHGPGLVAQQVKPGVWHAARTLLPAGRYPYRFLLDDQRWLADPVNPRKSPNGVGGFDSILVIPGEQSPGEYLQSIS